MEISVVICTYNRCESLRRTLKTFSSLTIPKELKWELLVVNNNSKDATEDVCADFEDALPLRYIFESQQGKSFALNRSIDEAQGSLILFTDDDVDLDANWILSYVDAAQRHPDASFFGGRVVACWEEKPPAWLKKNQSWLHAVVQMDRGETEQLVAKDEHPFFLGANMACRQKVFQSGVRFAKDIGPKGSDDSQSGNVRGEEMVLQRQLILAGLKGVYVGQSLVNHRHAPHRLTEKYIRKWYRGHGIAEVRCGQIPQKKLCFGAPRYFWKMLLFSRIKYFLTRRIAPSRIWLKAETDFAFASGVISESRKQTASANK